MLRCLLVALRRSGCACCYGSVPTAPRRSCATGSRVGGSGFFNLALEPSHLRHSARVLTTSHVPTHNTCATKHSRLSHSLRVIRIVSCAFTFWMLRCLLVALRRSGCACCYGSVPTIVVRLELAIVSHVIGDNFAAVCGGRSRLGYSVLPIGFCWILESVVWSPAPLDVFGSSARSVLNDVAVLEGSPVRLWSETQRQVLDVAIGHTILEPCCGWADVGGHVAVQQFVGCSSAGWGILVPCPRCYYVINPPRTWNSTAAKTEMEKKRGGS